MIFKFNLFTLINTAYIIYKKDTMMQNEFINIRNEKIAEKTIQALQKRQFEGYYAKTLDDVLKKAIELIPKSDVVSWGGATSAVQAGVIDSVIKNGYSVINRDNAKNPEEKTQMLRQALLCDTYIMGSNAISMDGQLVNIDAIGNRVSALMFGPKQVIIISSVKKIMPTLEDAIKRARTYAAPVNMQRIAKITGAKTPCTITGSCADCISPDSICSNIVITRLCNPKGRIKIILTPEDIGF